MSEAYKDISGRNIWVEITKSEHNHGGAEWEFGTCLWSPSRNHAGYRRYSLMKEPKKDDIVLHLYKNRWQDGITETRLCGSSNVEGPCYEVNEEPPSSGNWGNMSPYYRIDLKNYREYSNPLSLNTLIKHYSDEIRREIKEAHPKYYPFATYGTSIRTVQGIYIAKCTVKLYLLFMQALGINSSTKDSQSDSQNSHKEYAEGLRYSREIYFFSRNRKLVKQAKQHYGYSCQICGFNFKEFYGELGEDYIECHHLNPLSERAETELRKGSKTSIEDVTVLCSNCHRMVHRNKQALEVGELRQIIQEKNNLNNY